MKKKSKEFYDKKAFVVSADVFDVDVAVCINMSEKEIKKWVKKMAGTRYKDFDEDQLNDWDSSKTNLGRMLEFSGGFIVILKAGKKQFRKFVGVLVHELTHVSHYLLRNRRIDLSEETEEVYCYLVEHLTKQSLYKLY